MIVQMPLAEASSCDDNDPMSAGVTPATDSVSPQNSPISAEFQQVVVRPVALADLPGLLDLASLAGAGLTTLPRDPDILTRRIQASLRSFDRIASSPGGESYLFVMEALPSRRVIGASGIVSKVGGFEPFYSYQIEKTLFESKWINIRKEVPILRLHEEHDGPAEIGSLFLHPEFRHQQNGRFLQLVRFLFMAEHAPAFEAQVVSELRGVSDEQGRSPFWDALGRHFFGIDFRAADHLSVVNKRFIADLMPDHPIYIPLLPKEAQDVIGICHPHTVPAMKILEAEGFSYQHAVDIFDAGPVFGCPTAEIRAIRQSRKRAVTEVVGDAESLPPTPFMLGTTTEHFRAVKGPVLELPKNKGLRITAEAAESLQIRVGEPLRYVELKPASATHSS